MQQYRVKDWGEFQHYKDRSPPWIRLHKRLLDNYDFHRLPDASRALAPMLWLLASENKDPHSGMIEGTDEEIAFRIRRTVEHFREAIKPLIDMKFIELLHPASTALAACRHSATPETETEVEKEKKEQNVVVSAAAPPAKDESARPNPPPPPSKPTEPAGNLPLGDIVAKASPKPTYHAVQFHPRYDEVRRYIVHRLPHLDRQNATEVNRWLLEGADPEKDIFPTVNSTIELKRGDIGSFRYFTRGIESSVTVRKEMAEQHERMMRKYGEEDQRARERAANGEAK